jgi:hypothetical protein
MSSRSRIYGPATLLIILAAVGAFSTLQAEQPVAKAEAHDLPLALKQADGTLNWTDCPAIFPPGCKLAVLHGDPAAPGADVFLRVPAGYTIPAHWHTSAERMVLVSGSLDVTYAGHPTVRLETNDYAYGPARLPHDAQCRSATPCTLFIAFDQAVDAHAFQGELAEKP